MNNILVIDASVWVSWLIFHDANHESTLNWLRQYRTKNGRLTVPSFFIVEVAGTLSRVTKQEEETRKAIQDITSLHKMRVVQMNSSFMQLAANIAIDLHLRAGDAT